MRPQAQTRKIGTVDLDDQLTPPCFNFNNTIEIASSFAALFSGLLRYFDSTNLALEVFVPSFLEPNQRIA